MLAIIIPYYKRIFFEATLLSLSNQTDKRFNIYIGDDASPEDPTFLLEKFKGQFDFTYRRFESNLGGVSLVKQWERCIALSTNEEWIMILGDDDILENNCISSFYAHIQEIEQEEINVVRFATVVIDQNNEKLSVIHVHPKLEKSIDFLMRKFKGGTRSSLSEFIFRKATLLNIRFKDLPLAWYSDVLAILEFSGFNYIYTINEAVVCFRWSELNITSKGDNLKQKNIASFKFYHYLLNEKKFFFDLQQSGILLSRMEKTFLDNKKNIYLWTLFTKLYISNCYLKKYLIFMGKVVQSILKKSKA
ncbi:glycosyltransferase family 2 protein [Flavobacterium gawalongense]|uniref:Glycosyltransferase family 2 protein n=1 Tax=Flavobacterium gawalongense TaxID=2594432 RepID=A0A553BYX5_9FLAO|nr:glycosyltransferase [Flavobacterium gawalongense]TRX13477.1 glycosyltransferase family 2 protein [Flavobacterium gawalongense]TRX15591.1 glycosyltransferase family 2 protein [Flavobacterium gawalongense]TRX31429.1 glycosyltransferase family 2 protein [Flavobacterium gawalongense]